MHFWPKSLIIIEKLVIINKTLDVYGIFLFCFFIISSLGIKKKNIILFCILFSLSLPKEYANQEHGEHEEKTIILHIVVADGTVNHSTRIQTVA